MAYFFSNIISPPSSATNESNATVVRVRDEPEFTLPMEGLVARQRGLSEIWDAGGGSSS